jgi:23S rRNA A1618 N6-methylase RlmF
VITIQESTSVSASNPEFHDRLEKAIRSNRRILHTLVKELQIENIITLDDLNELPQGYKTKMLHVITHFLDGFFGIDTYFYNLVEDSHWVSEEMQSRIVKNPSDFRLLSLDARI